MSHTQPKPNRLLVVDDEPGIVEFIAEVATDMGYQVETADGAAGFQRIVKEFDPTVIVLDLQLPQSDGVQLLRTVGDIGCSAKVLLISGMDKRVMSATRELGMSRGVAMLGLLPKPLLIEDLEAKLSEAYLKERRATADDLREGLARGEVRPYFQPKAYLTEDHEWQILGAEALARWEHPQLGLVMPDQFIPLAESAGLMTTLSATMLAETLQQIRHWLDGGLDLRCAVNIPPSMVIDLSFPDQVALQLSELGLDGRHLILEITEAAAIEQPTLTMDILTRLRVKRIGLALDDFGTGFSSLTQLYQMPFDELKIDKSLVMNIPNSREANTMVGSLIDLAHNLGLSVCAEGVESRAALDLLATLGCDACQGFYISRPVPATDIEPLVRRWNETQQPLSKVTAK